MKTHTLNRDLDHGWNINTSNHDWILAPKAEIEFFSSETGATGIHQKAAAKNNLIDIRGDISVYGEQTIGVHAEGSSSVVKVRRSSEIAADHGIELGSTSTGMTVRNAGLIHGDYGIYANSANGAKIINSGDIFATDTGIEALGVGSVVSNSGLISGLFGVRLSGADSRFTNAATGVVNGYSGIMVEDNSLDDTITIVNKGEIVVGATNYAIFTVNASVNVTNVNVTNTGTIFGNVQLGAGNDVFDTADGVLSGFAAGGKGDDIFIVKDDTQLIFEAANAGEDTVKTASNYTLGANFENLVLLGTGQFDGTGNALNNKLAGNAAANSLSGMAGADRLDGAGGDDLLNGGAGADIFVFHTGYGTDTIVDFADGQDKIELSGFTGISSYAQLAAHKTTVGADVIFDDFGNGETLIIKGGGAMTFSDADFIFA